MPILTKPIMPMTNPAMMAIHAKLEPIEATGTIMLRSMRGAYDLACCTAWPVSWAAMPTEASEGLRYTSGESRTTFFVGS